MNLMLAAQDWAFADNSSWPEPNTLGPNGLPLSTAMGNGGASTVFETPTQTERSGNYVVITTGIGTILATGLSSTPVSGTNTRTVVSGASLGANSSISFSITAQDASTPITKIAWVHVDDEAAYMADNLAFGVKFMSVMRQVKWGVVRFLNWQNGNFTNETNWASRKPMTNWSFAASTYPSQFTNPTSGKQEGYLGQTTSATPNDYAISDSVGTAAPVERQTILLRYNDFPVTITSGANSVISWTAHGLTTGMPFSMFTVFGGTVPGGLDFNSPTSGGPEVYYAIVLTAGTLRFATSYANAIAGTAITTSSTGSQVRAHAQVVDTTVTVNIGASTLGWPHHFLATGDCVAGSGQNPSSNTSVGINYYAVVIDADTIKLATTRANALANTTITLTGSAAGASAWVKQPTLNLNGTGAVPIRGLDGTPVTIGANNTPSSRIYVNHLVHTALMFDAVLGIWIQAGGTAATGGPAGIRSGVPPEVCLKLCKELGAHPFFESPLYALDPMTDYMPSLMQYCKDNGYSWMIHRIEGFNEPWNNRTMARYLQYKSFAYYALQEYPGFEVIGKYSSMLGQAAATVWPGGKNTKYKVLLGLQTGQYLSGVYTAGNAQLTSARYVSSGPAQSPYLQEPAYKWITTVAVANYMTPALTDTAGEATMVANWVAAGSSPTSTILNDYTATLAGPNTGNGFNLTGLLAMYQNAWTWARGNGVSGGWGGLYQLDMCGYEGGYSYEPVSGNTAAFRYASKMVANVGIGLTGGTLSDGTVVVGTYNDFINSGGDNPSCFHLGGTGPWGVLDPNIYLTPQPSQFTAMEAFN